MDAVGIIQSVERFGAELLPNDGYVRIKKGKYLPDSITSSIADHKREILAILERDSLAKEADFMIAIPGELYTITLSNVSSIYVERIAGRWEAWIETHYPHQSIAISSKIIASGNTLGFVFVKVTHYLDYIAKKEEASIIAFSGYSFTLGV